jgi:hypothetical protein
MGVTALKGSPAGSAASVQPPVDEQAALSQPLSIPLPHRTSSEGSSSSSEGADPEDEPTKPNRASVAPRGTVGTHRERNTALTKKRAPVESVESECSDSSHEDVRDRAVTSRMVLSKVSLGIRAFTNCRYKCRYCDLLMDCRGAYAHYAVKNCRDGVASGTLVHFPCPHCTHLYMKRRDLEDHLALVGIKPGDSPSAARDAESNSSDRWDPGKRATAGDDGLQRRVRRRDQNSHDKYRGKQR